MNLVLAIIIACEIGFWVLIVAGLIVRYVLGRRRTGLVLLALTPLVDLILLVATVLDLRSGATAGTAHGLAAVYLGISIAYGHKMIGWADTRFAHHFADGPRPTRLYGMSYARECWKDVVRTVAAALIAAGFLYLLIALVDDPGRTAALAGFCPILGLIVLIDLVWAIGYTLWPRRQPSQV